ncbi:hypothetical protein BESB_070850 [Besnoitia besnoiti]|uniref:Uncharacterized protein n=1 Tax=Besnoitia besnoiti TaxID=94643 RepID=A0A2A9ME36_BESBE|nr:uncharacterized protein BESB_070850 [Besnoitia besnoiti]PFH33933.1 hypothetical protein BESB_070850 [Besnoitia besnoiti]
MQCQTPALSNVAAPAVQLCRAGKKTAWSVSSSAFRRPRESLRPRHRQREPPPSSKAPDSSNDSSFPETRQSPAAACVAAFVGYGWQHTGRSLVSPAPRQAFNWLREPPGFFRKCSRRTGRTGGDAPGPARDDLEGEQFVGRSGERQVSQKRVEAAAAAASLVRSLLVRPSRRICGSWRTCVRRARQPYVGRLCSFQGGVCDRGEGGCVARSSDAALPSVFRAQQALSGLLRCERMGGPSQGSRGSRSVTPDLRSSFIYTGGPDSSPCVDVASVPPDAASSPALETVQLFQPSVDFVSKVLHAAQSALEAPASSSVPPSKETRACHLAAPGRRDPPLGDIPSACRASAEGGRVRTPDLRRQREAPTNSASPRSTQPPCGSEPPPGGCEAAETTVERAVLEGDLRLLNVALTEALARASSPQEVFRLVVQFRAFFLPANAVTALHTLARMKRTGRKAVEWVEVSPAVKADSSGCRRGLLLHPCVSMLLRQLVGTKRFDISAVSPSSLPTASCAGPAEQSQEAVTHGSEAATDQRRLVRRQPPSGGCVARTEADALGRSSQSRGREKGATVSRLARLSPRHLPVALWSVAKLLKTHNPAHPGCGLPRGTDSVSRTESARSREAKKEQARRQPEPDRAGAVSASGRPPGTEEGSRGAAAEASELGMPEQPPVVSRDWEDQQSLLCAFYYDALVSVESRAAELAPQGVTMISWALTSFCEGSLARTVSKTLSSAEVAGCLQLALNALGRRLVVFLERQMRREMTAEGRVSSLDSGAPARETGEGAGREGTAKWERHSAEDALSSTSASDSCGWSTTSEEEEMNRRLTQQATTQGRRAVDEGAEERGEDLPAKGPQAFTQRGGREVEDKAKRQDPHDTREPVAGPREVCTYLRACSSARVRDWSVVLPVITTAFQSSGEIQHVAECPRQPYAQPGASRLSRHPGAVIASCSPHAAATTSQNASCRAPSAPPGSCGRGLNLLPHCRPQDIVSLAHALREFLPYFQELLCEQLHATSHSPLSGCPVTAKGPATSSLVFAACRLPLMIAKRAEEMAPQLGDSQRTQVAALVRLAESHCVETQREKQNSAASMLATGSLKKDSNLQVLTDIRM